MQLRVRIESTTEASVLSQIEEEKLEVLFDEAIWYLFESINNVDIIGVDTDLSDHKVQGEGSYIQKEEEEEETNNNLSIIIGAAVGGLALILAPPIFWYC